LQSWIQRQAEIAALAQRQLFFVGGAPRSGTTWLQHILDAHPDICCRGEGHFLQFLAEPLGHAMQRRREQLQGKNARLFRDLGGYKLPDPEDVEFLVGSAILSALLQQCDGHPYPIVGEKTPENVFYFPNLKRLFPGAKFVGIARDPRDILVSAWHLIPRGRRQGDEAIEQMPFIRQAVGAVGQFTSGLLSLRQRYPADVLIVTYEALLSDPETTVGALYRFLGAADSPAIVADSIARTSFAAMSGRPAGVEDNSAFMRKGVAGDWRVHLTPEMNELILGQLGPLFAQFGWER
jgi:Sulfotransferase family